MTMIRYGNLSTTQTNVCAIFVYARHSSSRTLLEICRKMQFSRSDVMKADQTVALVVILISRRSLCFRPPL